MLTRGVLHADETPVAMVKPANLRDGQAPRAYLWSYCTNELRRTARGGVRLRRQPWRAAPQRLPRAASQRRLTQQAACTTDSTSSRPTSSWAYAEADCKARQERRKFHELWVNHQSSVGEQALKFFIQVCASFRRPQRKT